MVFEARVKLDNERPVVVMPERGTIAQRLFEAFGEAEMHVTFKRIVKTKTQPQLGYFYAVVLPEITAAMREGGQDDLTIELLDQDGFLTGFLKRVPLTERSARAFLKAEFLPSLPVVDTETGEHVGSQPPSFARLDHEQMGEFIKKCIVWAAERLGITVTPSPSEQAWLHLGQNHEA